VVAVGADQVMAQGTNWPRKKDVFSLAITIPYSQCPGGRDAY
jgi:hypothetical protein